MPDLRNTINTLDQLQKLVEYNSKLYSWLEVQLESLEEQPALNDEDVRVILCLEELLQAIVELAD